jgi:signal transduction histidine kinase
VLSRRLSLKLLAPTVLVSLVLAAACSFGLLYLNNLHVNASDVLSENEKSTRAAIRLETAARALLHLLEDHLLEERRPGRFAGVWDQYEELRRWLNEAQKLANHEQEEALVAHITQGALALGEELKAWRFKLPSRAAARRPVTLLAKDVLPWCRRLTQYNMGQIEESDRENRAIVATLRWGMLAVGLGGPLIGLLLGYAVARGLSHSIYQLSVRIRDAAGRLNREVGSVTLEEKGDLPDLHREMQGVIEEIERVVERLQQREREVLRAEQLAAVGQVAAGVAHELRNPLTSVKMLVQTGLEGARPAGLPPEDLSVIEHEIRRMEQCIRLFIDFARPPQAERRRTDLAVVLRRALALVEGRARRQKVTLAGDLPADPVFLEVDPEQIHQVAVNLLLNSLDALPRGGTVYVTLTRPERGPWSVERKASSPALRALRSTLCAVEVRVQDTGPGIAPRIHQRLFEPFVSSKETGLGLGLSISKRLVEAHGGTIRGENTPEGGAVFTFTLPT